MKRALCVFLASFCLFTTATASAEYTRSHKARPCRSWRKRRITAYAKRDCVEKTFEALKSHLGMDKIGVTTEEAMHGKGLVWFVAFIFHALLFNTTASLRVTDRKHYTVPAMIDQLESIKADRNLATGKRERRYKLTSKQQKILRFW